MWDSQFSDNRQACLVGHCLPERSVVDTTTFPRAPRYGSGQPVSRRSEQQPGRGAWSSQPQRFLSLQRFTRPRTRSHPSRAFWPEPATSSSQRAVPRGTTPLYQDTRLHPTPEGGGLSANFPVRRPKRRLGGHPDGRDEGQTDQRSSAADLVRRSPSAAFRTIPGVREAAGSPAIRPAGVGHGLSRDASASSRIPGPDPGGKGTHPRKLMDASQLFYGHCGK